MRRVAAIAGILLLVAGVVWFVRPDPNPMPEAAAIADSEQWEPPDDTSADSTVGESAGDGELRGRGTGTATSVVASDASPGANSMAIAPSRPHLRRTILDEEGRPLAGARVEALATTRDDVFRDRENRAVLAQALTDASGRVDVELVGGERAGVLRVTATGRPSTVFYAWESLRTLRLRPTTLVRGRVITRGTETPVAGAFIEAASSDSREASLTTGPYVSTRSASDGTFTLHVPGTGVVFLSAQGVSSGEFKEIRVGEGALPDLVFALVDPGPEGVVEGRVRLEDRPVAGVRVVLAANVLRPIAVSSAPTGADGTFRVGPVWTGMEEIVVDATAIGFGRSRQSIAIEVRDGRASRDVTLPRPWSISGRVTRAGTGIGGAVVTSRSSAQGRESSFVTATTDVSGTFRLVGACERRPQFMVQATAPEGDSAACAWTFDTESWDVDGLVIELKKFGRLRGRVLAAVQTPIAGALVHARSDIVTGPDGRFDVVTDPGKARVSVSCEGYVSRTSAWAQVPEGDRGAEMDVVLDTGGVVSGRVFGATDVPLVGAVVQVDGKGGIGGSSTVRVYAKNGAFVTQVIAGATFRVTVSADGYVTRVFDGVVPDTDLPRVVLERAPSSSAPR